MLDGVSPDLPPGPPPTRAPDAAPAHSDEAAPTEIDLPKLLGEEINARFGTERTRRPERIWTDPDTGWDGLNLGIEMPHRKSGTRPEGPRFEVSGGTVYEGWKRVITHPNPGDESSWSVSKTEYKLPEDEEQYDPGRIETTQLIMRDGVLTYVKRAGDMSGSTPKVEELPYDTLTGDQKRGADVVMIDTATYLMGPNDPRDRVLRAMKQ